MNDKKRFILDRAFDAFIIRLNEGLLGCHYSRSNLDFEAWYKALSNVYCELSAFIKEAQKPSRLQILRDLGAKVQLYLQNQYKEDSLYWELFELELFLHEIIEKEKLQEKKHNIEYGNEFI
jgi:hypothetical protein